MNNNDGRLAFHRRWSRLKPPLRPDAQIVSAYRQIIADCDDCVLLLGVTAELAGLGRTLCAVDRDAKMIAETWPGDTETRKALCGDWFNMPSNHRAFTAAIGDGVLTFVRFAEYENFFGQLANVLLPGARIAIRLYETPEPGETTAAVRTQALAGNIRGFHAFKWRLAMALASEARDTAVPVAVIHEAFQSAFPDRALLSTATGWSLDEIEEIDAYDEQDIIYQFPTRRELLAHLPRDFINLRFVPSGDYELAERCPIFVAEFRP